MRTQITKSQKLPNGTPQAQDHGAPPPSTHGQIVEPQTTSTSTTRNYQNGEIPAQSLIRTTRSMSDFPQKNSSKKISAKGNASMVPSSTTQRPNASLAFWMELS